MAGKIGKNSMIKNSFFYNNQNKKNHEFLKKIDFFSEEIKKKNTINEEEAQLLMTCVMNGDIEGTKKQLEKKPELVFVQTKFSDYAGRIFPKITAFQYAIWSGDWAIWELMRDEKLGSLLTDDYAAFQYYALKYQTQEVTGNNGWIYKFDDLLLAYEELWRYFDQDNKEKRDECFIEKVGAAQKKVPAWYRQLMCNEKSNNWTGMRLSSDSAREMTDTTRCEQYSGWYMRGDLGETSARARGNYTSIQSFNMIFVRHVLLVDSRNTSDCGKILGEQLDKLGLSLPSPEEIMKKEIKSITDEIDLLKNNKKDLVSFNETLLNLIGQEMFVFNFAYLNKCEILIEFVSNQDNLFLSHEETKEKLRDLAKNFRKCLQSIDKSLKFEIDLNLKTLKVSGINEVNKKAIDELLNKIDKYESKDNRCTVF